MPGSKSVCSVEGEPMSSKAHVDPPAPARSAALRSVSVYALQQPTVIERGTHARHGRNRWQLRREKAAEIASTLAGEGQVTVYTVVEVSRQMLNDMRASAADASDDKAREISVEYRTTQAGDAPVSRWVGDDVVVANYVKGKVSERTSELAAELEAVGADFSVVGEEGENAAKSVLDAALNLDVDVLCIGTRGLGRFDGLLGSLATKVARRASCSVLLVR